MFKNLLKEKNIRITPMRLSVLEVFNQYENALSIQTIEEEIGEHDRVTLYRTLKTFTEKGITHEIIMPGGEKRMALCAHDCNQEGHTHHHEHIHFQCEKCNEIFCVEAENFPQIELNGFKIESIEIIAKGYCNSCTE